MSEPVMTLQIHSQNWWLAPLWANGQISQKVMKIFVMSLGVCFSAIDETFSIVTIYVMWLSKMSLNSAEIDFVYFPFLFKALCFIYKYFSENSMLIGQKVPKIWHFESRVLQTLWKQGIQVRKTGLLKFASFNDKLLR